MASSRDNSKLEDTGDVQYMPVATSATIAIGDLLCFETGTARTFTAETDDDLFCGVAGSKYPPVAGVTSIGQDVVKVYKKGIFTFDIDATTAANQSAEYKYASGGNKVVKSTSNQVGRLWKPTTSTDTVVQLKIDAYVKF